MFATKAEFATHMGVNKSQPTRWAALGMPVRHDGTVDVAQAEAWVAKNIRTKQRRAAARRRAAATPEPARSMTGHLDGAGRAVLAAVLDLASAVPSTAAIAAVEAGAGAEAASAVADRTAAQARMWIAEALDRAGVPPPPGRSTWEGSVIGAAVEFLECSDAELADAVAEAAAEHNRTAPAWGGAQPVRRRRAGVATN